MANTFNLIGNADLITFNLGSHSLEFNPTDKKSQELAEKADELKAKAENLEDGNEWEVRKQIKVLLDDFFSVMFDAEAPSKIYEASGENTWNYLKVFLQISNAVLETKKRQENDETFKKYLAE
ncbi:TPA: hypothetical protein ACGO11_000555 [Streptococcus suis]